MALGGILKGFATTAGVKLTDRHDSFDLDDEKIILEEA